MFDKTNKAKNLLLRVADYFEVDSTHWTKGVNSIGRTTFCTYGAIREFSPSEKIQKEALRILALEIGKIYPYPTHNPYMHNPIITSFNDEHDRKEVIEMLRSAAGEPKAMEIGTPEKEYTIEPAEPVPGIIESPSSPTPEPRKEPAKPEREKVPA